MEWLLDALAAVGRATIGACGSTGRLTLFAAEGLSHLVRPPFYGRSIRRAFVEVAYFSLPVVALTAIFTGMVLALQSYTGFARFNAPSAIANVVVLSVMRELGPVLAGLMVAGRVGAAMAAELGTMRVTDQIDALSTLSTNPMKYLVAPRLLAGMVALPLLVVIADILGVIGGFLVGTLKLGFNPVDLSAQHVRLHAGDRRGLRPGQGGGVRLHHRADGLLPRLPLAAAGRRAWARPRPARWSAASILILAFDYVLTELFFSR